MSCLPLWFCSVPGHRLERREARESSGRHPPVLHQPRREGEIKREGEEGKGGGEGGREGEGEEGERQKREERKEREKREGRRRKLISRP